MSKAKKSELSVIRLPAAVSARVDAWALLYAADRSDAIRQLIEIGLKAKPKGASRISCDDAAAIESRVVSQLDGLIDPGTPQDERDRRIHRLTDGPPEFVDLRIDLPSRRPH